MKAPRGLRAASIMAALVVLASCKFVGNDNYPDYEKRLLARTDLDAIVKSASGSSLTEVGEMSGLEGSGSSALFVEVRAANGAHLLAALDGDSLADAKCYDFDAYGLKPQVGLAASGGYVSGNALFSPSRDLVSGSMPSMPFLLSESGLNYFLSVSSSLILQISVYDSSFAYQSIAAIDVASSGSWSLVSAKQGGGGYGLLFRNDGSGYFRAFRIPSFEALRQAAASSAWTSLFDDAAVPSAYKGAAFRSDYGSAWLTVDGPVLLSYGNNGVTFTIEPFSGASSDYTLSNMGDASFSFGGAGDSWFMYERKSGKLDKLRTWW